MPPSTDTYVRVAPPSSATGLTVPTSYSVNTAGPAIARPGSTDEPRHRAGPRAAHSCATIARSPSPSSAGGAGSSCVVYAMPNPPPRSSSRQLDAVLVADPRVQRRAPGGRRPRTRTRRRSASRCASAGRPARSRRVAQHAGARRRRRRPRRARSRTSGPRAPWRCTRACAPRRRPSPAPGPAGTRRAARPAGPAGRSRRAESTMNRPTPASSARVELGLGLVVAVEARSAPGRSRPAAPAASSPPVHTSRPRPSSATQPQQRRAEERLAGVVDVERRRRPSRNAAAPRTGSRPRRATYAGVPYSAARSRTSTPPTVRTPSAARSAVADHSVADQRVDVGRLPQPVRAAVTGLGVQGTGLVRARHASVLHPVGGA